MTVDAGHDPLIEVGERALLEILKLRSTGGREDKYLRITVREKTPTTFLYDIRFVAPEKREREDSVVSHQGVEFLIDPETLPRIRGATLDFDESPAATGFRFMNPNQPRLLGNPVAVRVHEILETDLNRSLATHGGQVSLVDIQGGEVHLRFSGGCQGCSMKDVTLTGGIERRLKELVPEIERVVDVTDHGLGKNPYYTGNPSQSKLVALPKSAV